MAKNADGTDTTETPPTDPTPPDVQTTVKVMSDGTPLPKLDETVPGGAYRRPNGTWFDAEGRTIDKPTGLPDHL